MSRINKSPKHGTTNDTPESESQADGTAANAPRGETKAQPSGYRGDNPATAGKQSSPARSHMPENRQKAIRPSAPIEGTEGVENAGPIPSGKGSPLNDTFGEAGDPFGRGNLEIPDMIVHEQKNFPASNFTGNSPTADRPSTEGASEIKRKRDREAA